MGLVERVRIIGKGEILGSNKKEGRDFRDKWKRKKRVRGKNRMGKETVEGQG